jgi:hypothetical protein
MLTQVENCGYIKPNTAVGQTEYKWPTVDTWNTLLAMDCYVELFKNQFILYNLMESEVLHVFCMHWSVFYLSHWLSDFSAVDQNVNLTREILSLVPRYLFSFFFCNKCNYLQVTPPFRFRPNIRSINLPSRNYGAVTGTKARVSGWGHSQVVRASAAVMAQNKLLTNQNVRKQEVRF